MIALRDPQDILPAVQHSLDFRNSKISVASAKEVIFFFPVLLNAFPEISAAIADANDLIPAIQPLSNLILPNWGSTACMYSMSTYRSFPRSTWS